MAEQEYIPKPQPPKMEVPKTALIAAGDDDQGNHFSIAPSVQIITQLVPFQKAIDNFEAQTGRAVINSAATYQKGVEFLSLVRQYDEQLEAFRKSVYMPVFDYAKFIQSLFKPKGDAIASIKKLFGKKMIDYEDAEKARLQKIADEGRKAQEEAALKLAAEEEKRGNTEVAAAIVEAASAAPMPVAAPRFGTTSSTGLRGGSAKRWVGRPEDPMAILKAILELKVPISVIEWKEGEMNKVAAGIKVVGTHHGIKVTQESSFGVRK